MWAFSNKVAVAGVGDGGVLLHGDAEEGAERERVEQRHRAHAPDRERERGAREERAAAQREKRERGRDVEARGGHRGAPSGT